MVKCSIPSKTKLAENYFVLLMNYKCQTRIMCLIYGLFLVLWLLLANTKVQWEFRTCTIDYLTNNRLITESSLALQLHLFKNYLIVYLYLCIFPGIYQGVLEITLQYFPSHWDLKSIGNAPESHMASTNWRWCCSCCVQWWLESI